MTLLLRALMKMLMKTMTCNDMGGSCDVALSGDTPEEMIANATKHVEEAHPEMAANIKNMTAEETATWRTDFQTKWDAIPETAETTVEEAM